MVVFRNFKTFCDRGALVRQGRVALPSMVEKLWTGTEKKHKRCWAQMDNSENIQFLNLEKDKGGHQFLKLGTGPEVAHTVSRLF